MLLAAAAILLFVVWSNSFVAVSFLLGREGAAARFDFVALTVARFLPAALVAGVYCLGFRAAESWAVVRRHGGRLLVCGLLAVPSYNFAINAGQQLGVPAPIASLTTALLPLFLLVLSRLLLGESIRRRQVVGFLVALAGMLLIAAARRGQVGAAAGTGFATSLAVTALAPLSWAFFTIFSKPVYGRGVSPVLWTYLAIFVGTLPLALLAPFAGGAELVRLDAAGWTALLYLSWPCTVAGFAVWGWLLRHLKASIVGLTVFLNPPLTTLSKLVLQALFPATFVFELGASDLAGGGMALLGLAIAVLPRLAPGARRPRA